MRWANNLKEGALRLLMEEVSVIYDRNVHQAYSILAEKNAVLRGVTAKHFCYVGTLYPKDSNLGLVFSSPALHCSLYDCMDKIQKEYPCTDINEYRNFFMCVLSRSFNNIVLEATIPSVLLNAVKTKLTAEEYNAINFGTSGGIQYEPIEATKKSIEFINKYYAGTKEKLRFMLVERLILGN